MRAVPVVVVIPVLQGLGSLIGILVDKSIGPLAQSLLDEPLGFAIGLRPVRPPEAMAHAQLPACGSKVLGTEGRTVVGRQPLNGHNQAAVVGHRVMQELHRLGRLLVRMHVREGNTRVIVDGHEQRLPAGPID